MRAVFFGLWRTRRGGVRGKGCLCEGLEVLRCELILHGKGGVNQPVAPVVFSKSSGNRWLFSVVPHLSYMAVMSPRHLASPSSRSGV